jgi:hypothetical protein
LFKRKGKEVEIFLREEGKERARADCKEAKKGKKEPLHEKMIEANTTGGQTPQLFFFY